MSFKLKYAAISLILWTVNKPCYNDPLSFHKYTKIIGLKRKRHLFGAKKLNLFSGIDISGKCQSTKLLRMCKRKKKRCRRDTSLTFCLVWNTFKTLKRKYLQVLWGIFSWHVGDLHHTRFRKKCLPLL